jgi:hypothetical protein
VPQPYPQVGDLGFELLETSSERSEYSRASSDGESEKRPTLASDSTASDRTDEAE